MADQVEMPVFQAKRSVDFPEFVIVMCPRPTCPSYARDTPFLVHRATWLRPYRYKKFNGDAHLITGRSCPYCFMSARLPRRNEVD